MNKYSFTNNGKMWKRITKKQARAAYVNGLTVAICPVNFRLFSRWQYPYMASRRSREQFIIDDIGAKNDFNNIVSSFEFYNCRDNETGRYAAFYIALWRVEK